MAKVSQAWKDAERRFSTSLRKAVGPVKDRGLLKLLTKTGRAGPAYDLQVDFFCGEAPVALAGEVKRHKLPLPFRTALKKIVARAAEWNRIPIFCWSLAADMPERTTEYKDTQTGKTVRVPMPKHWCAVPLEVMSELLLVRRYVAEVGELSSDFLDWTDSLGLLAEDSDDSQG